MIRRLSVAAALVVVAGIAALYTHRLADTPAYVSLDEAHFANHAYSLASTGRDLNGNRLPLFISLEDPLGDRPVLPWGTTWYHPVGFYAIASVLTVAPLGEWAMRLPMALLGVLNVVLIYLVALKWFGSRTVAIAAAALLAMTPAHFILSRMALDYVLPLPFTLAWLLAVAHLRASPSRTMAMATGLVLGAGCYSYVSSWLMMPAYLVITGGLLWKDARRPDLLAPLAIAFCVPLLALLPWIALHPEMPGNILAQYQAGETRQSLVSAIVRGTGVADAFRTTLSAYWSYFNPSFLFVTGGSSRLVSTGSIGVWPAAVAVLWVMALVRFVTRAQSAGEVVLIAGLLLAPVPATLKGEPFAVQRAISLLPFGALLAAAAINSALKGPLIQRAIVLVALVTVPVQFSGFIGDYFGAYRVRSAAAIDSTAFKESAAVLGDLIQRSAPPAIALMAPMNDVSAKWRFYATVSGHVEWLSKTRYFSGRFDELASLPSGSLAVVETSSLSAHEGWRPIAAPVALFGDAPLTILQRQ